MRVSVIIPVLNEEAGISGFLTQLSSLGAHEIIVADGGSADRTVWLAQELGARVTTSSPGRGPQMNAGAAIATGDVFLFLHADVRLGPNAISAITQSLADAGKKGGIFDVFFDGDDWIARTFYFIYHWRRYVGIFYGDAGIFVRREVFRDMGGFRNFPIMEDYEFGRRLFGPLREFGRQIVFLDEPIFVSDRRWRKAGLVRTVWVWVLIQTFYSLGISPEPLGRLYRQIR